MNNTIQRPQDTGLQRIEVLPPGRNSRRKTGFTPVETAILKTICYADIFDYPLTAQEIHTYLIGVRTSFETVASTLRSSPVLKELIEPGGEGYFTLIGREASFRTRQTRSKVAQRLRPKAFRYGCWIGRFPFVRMVALTGALAVENAGECADIDYLIVTENGRLWTCRALILPLVRTAALWGDTICPNYYLAERSISFSQQDLYTAHEIAQMVPIAGWETYWRLRQLNRWVLQFLPNAAGPTAHAARFTGKALSAPVVQRATLQRFERWEMERKIRKFQEKYAPVFDEAAFSPDWCKGHFDGHRQRTLDAYSERISRFWCD